jgi:hypothetical protein
MKEMWENKNKQVEMAKEFTLHRKKTDTINATMAENLTINEAYFTFT